MHIRACDFIADGFQEMHAEDPYEAMAEKMVYRNFTNGSVKQRIEGSGTALPESRNRMVLFYLPTGAVRGTIGASSLIKQSLERQDFRR